MPLSTSFLGRVCGWKEIQRKGWRELNATLIILNSWKCKVTDQITGHASLPRNWHLGSPSLPCSPSAGLQWTIPPGFHTLCTPLPHDSGLDHVLALVIETLAKWCQQRLDKWIHIKNCPLEMLLLKSQLPFYKEAWATVLNGKRKPQAQPPNIAHKWPQMHYVEKKNHSADTSQSRESWEIINCCCFKSLFRGGL